jgi:hypothetical protein
MPDGKCAIEKVVSILFGANSKDMGEKYPLEKVDV